MKFKFQTTGLSGDELALAQKMNALFEQMPEGLSKEDIANELKSKLPGLFDAEGKPLDIKSMLDAAIDDTKPGSLKSILKTQGEAITEIKNKLNTSGGGRKTLLGELQARKEKLDEIKKYKRGEEVIQLKTVTSITSNTSSGSVPANPYFPLPTETDVFVDIQLPALFILDYVDKGETSSPSLLWTEQSATVFGAAIVTEGSVKPFTTKSATRRVSQYHKIAAVLTITEELDKDLPKLATNFRRLFTDEVMRTHHNQILADIIAAVPGYVNTAMNGLIVSPDNYGAIAAAVAQIQSFNFEPDFLAINPTDFWIMNQIKDNVGQYNIPPFVTIDMGEMRFAQLRLIVNPAIAQGSFLVGQAKTYKVDIYEDYTLRMGFINDDFARNQYSAVGEIKYHSYIPTNHTNAWCYAQYAVVQAAIAAQQAA